MASFTIGDGDLSETRAEPRKILRRPAKLMRDDATPMAVRTVDISAGGMCLVAENPLEIGQTCEIAFDVLLSDKSRKISVQGKVTYCVLRGTEGFRTGIRITQVDPGSESFLRTLLQ